MLITVRSFLHRHFACWVSENFLFLVVPETLQDIRFSDTVVVTTTQMQSQMLRLDQTKMQEQGLTGYSSVLLTSRASHRLDKCRLPWVWLGFGLLSALSECNACSGRGSHRHASSGFVSVQTDPTAQSWHDLVRTSVYLFTLIVLFSEEGCCFFHSSGHAVLVRSFSYTPRAGFSEEFLLHSSNC